MTTLEEHRYYKIREFLSDRQFKVCDMYISDTPVSNCVVVLAEGRITHKTYVLLISPHDTILNSEWFDDYSEAKFEFELRRPG